MDNKEMIDLVNKIFAKEAELDALTKEVKSMKDELKTEFENQSMTEFTAGGLTAVLKYIPETKIADTDALKAAGIFDEYSKIKKGYTALTVKEAKA